MYIVTTLRQNIWFMYNMCRAVGEYTQVGYPDRYITIIIIIIQAKKTSGAIIRMCRYIK